MKVVETYGPFSMSIPYSIISPIFHTDYSHLITARIGYLTLLCLTTKLLNMNSQGCKPMIKCNIDKRTQKEFNQRRRFKQSQ